MAGLPRTKSSSSTASSVLKVVAGAWEGEEGGVESMVLSGDAAKETLGGLSTVVTVGVDLSRIFMFFLQSLDAAWSLSLFG